jgi:hypothetical protein
MLPPPMTRQISTPSSWTAPPRARSAFDGGRVQAEALIAHQRLAGDLQHDAGHPRNNFKNGRQKFVFHGQNIPDQPVLIAGPTASGKSALALEIAEASGRRDRQCRRAAGL